MNIQSPLTAFNVREKQYKRSLSGTYGKNYKKSDNGAKQTTYDQKQQVLQEKKEMRELLADLNLASSSAIPNSYLYQPESEAREWMRKRGKGNLIYYDKAQVQQMRAYFKELDTDKSGMIGTDEIEETLISLGLARTKEDVQRTVQELDADGNGELDFDEFLQMLKDTSMRNSTANYLKDRNLLFEDQTNKNTKRNKSREFGHASSLPPLLEEYQEYNFAGNLRQTKKELDMKEKDPKTIEQRKVNEKRWQKIKERIGVHPTAEAGKENSVSVPLKKYAASSFDVGSALIENEDDQASKHTAQTLKSANSNFS